jgi:hypothetical protein
MSQKPKIMTAAEKWQYARITEKKAMDHLTKLNPTSGQIAHSQAEATLIWFCREAGFGDLANTFENIADERGFTYTEVK